jgi:VCBS repeat-containing protein
MLLNLNISSWVQRITSPWFGLPTKKPQRRTVRIGTVERLERRELLTTFTVTTLNDDFESSDGVTSLREALFLANSNPGADQIQFDSGMNGIVNLQYGPLEIGDNVTITGNGAGNTIIKGQSNSGVFEISNGGNDVAFTGLTITGGNAATWKGGGIASFAAPHSSLSLNGVELSQNSASFGGGGIYAGRDTTLTITNSLITGNTTYQWDGKGGAIDGFGDLQIVNSQISGNSTQYDESNGGAIYWSSGDIVITDSTLDSNWTAGNVASGGAIFQQTGTLELNNTVLSGNQTHGESSRGGAIFQSQGALNANAGTVFYNNVTSGGNACGGAIYSQSSDVTITGALLIGNATQGPVANGGAIAAYSGTLTIANSTISGSAATGPANPYGLIPKGGAVYMKDGAVTVNSSTLANNTTTGFGGGAFVGSGRLTVINSTISGNSATTPNASTGGGIALFNAELAMDSSTVAYNTASDDQGGGGVDLFIGSAEINNSIIAKNIGGAAPDLRLPTITARSANLSARFAAPLSVKNSLVGNNQGSRLTAAATPSGQGNLIGTNAAPIDPQLLPLSLISGRTPTHQLQNNSPALNRGSSARANALGLTVDQTGHARIVGAAIDMGAFEVQGPSVSSIVRAAGEVNPTSASNVSFTITFTEAVSGVAPNQFSVIATGSVQSGNITVTLVSGSVYQVTINGITGLGTISLRFTSNGSTTSSATNLPIAEQTAFTSTEDFTLEESPTLFVQALDFAPGGTSPTTATSVNFKVTFSAAVQNVRASQFHLVTSGTVTSGSTQLSGSGKDYTLTINGIAGAGTLGLNFQGDGTIVRISDGQVITQPTFTGAVYTIVPGNQGSTDLEAGGLRFHVMDGGNFTTAGALNSFTGKVQVGFAPSAGNSFTPLAELNGTTSVNTSSLKFSATGAVKAVIGGTPLTLFAGGLTDISITDLINGQLAKADGSSLSVAGVTFTLASIRLLASPQPTISLQGSITLPAGIRVAVDGNNSVEINSSGVSLNGASLSLTNSFSVGGVTFSADDLAVSYSSTGNVFSLTGTAAVTVRDIAKLSVNFSETGLVINNGVFSSIDVTVDGEFEVKRVKITGEDLHFKYSEDTKQFSMSGTAGVEISGLDAEISVTFGSDDSPGIVITDGALDSLDMAVTGEVKVSKVTIKADALRVTYADDKYTMSGTAKVSVAGLGDLSVTFGDGTNPGLVVTNGNLVRLDMSISGEFEVSKVKVTADNLRFIYDAVTNSFSLSGTAGIKIDGISGDKGNGGLSVTFGYQGAPGIVVTDGKLQKLDITINASFEVKKVTIKAENVRFTYVAATSSFTLSGSASIKVSGMEGTGQDLGVGVKFGYGDAPGIVIENGQLKKLDVTINASFNVAKVKITAQDLRFTFDASTQTFTMAGSAKVDTTSFGFGVEFGYTDLQGVQHPGLVITDGRLEVIDVAVSVGFTVEGLRIDIENVRFGWIRSSNTFSISGGVRLAPAGLKDELSISASFGDSHTPGIVISDGKLVSMNFQISRTISVKALSISGQLSMTYTAATKSIAITGAAKITVAYLGEVNVKLGDPATGTQGLVIDLSGIRSFDMTVDANFSLSSVSLKGTLVLTYSRATGEFVATGSATLNIGSIGNVTATLGGNGTRGLVINSGGLQSLDMKAVAKFSVGPLSLDGTLDLSYSKATGRFVMYGSANGSFLGQSLFTADLGNVNNPGLVVYNGTLQSLAVTLRGGLTIQGVTLGSVSLTANYESSRGRFFFSGNASVNLPSFIPDWLASALGGRTLASIGVELNVIANNNHDSYFQAQATIAGTTFGFRKQFDGGLTFIGNPVLTKIADAVTSVVNWFSSWWGPLDGASIYYDPNFDFDLLNDLQTMTGADGRFDNIVPAGASSGQLVVVGGQDRSTGLTNPLRLTAPYDSKIVSPLTSLVNQLMQQAGLSAGDAMIVVNQALGIPMTTNLLGQSLALEATGGDAEAARSFSREVAVGTVVHEVSSLLSARPGAPTIAVLSTHGFAAIAEILSETGGAPLDLADPDVIREIIDRTADSAGLTIDSNIAASATTVIAGVNERIDDLPLDSTTSYLNRLLQIQTVTQGSIAPDLARLTAGQLSPTNFVNTYTDTALTTRINGATFGPLNVIGPVVAITPIVSQAVGAEQPTTFDFEVFLSSPTPSNVPVTVHYATHSLSGTVAGIDFQQTTGTLTWQPGDVAPKTISIPVFATNANLENRTFIVELSDVQNAELVSTSALGNIESSNFATTTTISSSDTSAEFGQELTFTANVTYQDPAHSLPVDGIVSFFDGDEFLGSAVVEAGVAQFKSSTLPAGTYHITAVYSGVLLTAEKYLPSESPVLTETVTHTGQIITFAAVPNPTIGDAPLVLNAISSSGLPITFKIVSGPATLNGEILTLVAPGTVVVEADQGGNSDFTSATPVTRTFTILDSETWSSNIAPVAQDGTAHVDPGTVVGGQLLATDVDDEEITFDVAVNPEHGTVVINSDGNYEYTADADFEGIDSFLFFALDGEVASNAGTITVTVGNPNLPPVVSAATFSLPENSAAATIVGVVTATDPNADQSKTFSITGGNVDGAFTINAATGEITVANPAALNFEGTATFSLTIQVSDNGDPVQSSTGTITINLTNVNETPTVTPATFTIEENSVATSAVGTVTASDPDADQTKSFVILSGNTGGAFSINPTTGVITVANAGPLNFEASSTFNLVIQATDNGVPAKAGTATITVNLTNVNEAPTVTPATFTIAENLVANTTVGTVTASDPDSGQTRSFTILSGNTGGAFAIDPTTGAITVANAGTLNFEASSTFNLIIQATDNGNPAKSGTATVSINLTDVNEAPTVTPATFTIAENSLVAAAVGTVGATDVDALQTRTFSITAGNTNGAFAINAQTGAITVANSAAVDFETTPTFNLTVQATDNGIPAKSRSATVTVNLTNVSEQPIIANGSGSITYKKLQAPVSLMPNVTVQSGGNAATLGRIVISVSVPKKGLVSDYSFGNTSALGTVTTAGPTDFKKSGGTRTTTITLNAGVTDAQVQDFLRNIKFSSMKMDPAKGSLGRKIEVQVFDRQGAGTPSSVLRTQIVARKK